MKNSPVHNLVDHLKNIYALPNSKSKFADKPDELTLKEQMSKDYRHPWKANGVVHDKLKVQRLPIGDLDNWEILRINLSQRSYQYPKKYHGMKVPAVGKQFSTFNCRDKDGKIPFLYESDVPKIERIRQKIYTKPFKRTNTVRGEIFGFPDKLTKKETQKLRPLSLKTFDNTKKI